MARAFDVPFTKNSADHHRALQPAFERCATPLAMATAKMSKLPKRLSGAVPLGAPARLSCAAAGVSSGLAGAVKAAIAKSKLCKNEADTVGGSSTHHTFAFWLRHKRPGRRQTATSGTTSTATTVRAAAPPWLPAQTAGIPVVF